MSKLPDDSSSLIVPVHLDAWVVPPGNTFNPVWYYASYDALSRFQSPVPDAFDPNSVSSPTIGVHLHWALPDALTHGVKPAGDAKAPIQFPLVPNRWLVVRFETKSTGWAAR